MVYTPVLPVNISCVSTAKSKKYMLFDVELITWLRREHHILGVLVGTLPQAPSQNVFLGLPLELLPEEVRLLVEKGLAHVIDDSVWFSNAARMGVASVKSTAYRKEAMRNGIEAADLARKAKQIKSAEGMEKMKLNLQAAAIDKQPKVRHSEADLEADIWFNNDDNKVATKPNTTLSEPFAITKASAGALASGLSLDSLTPAESSSYLLFKTLHDQGYFMSPGLRFGCQFTAYPGDPLRYHSHFLAVAVDSNKSIPLIDIVGGGRLATAVKKSFLLGAVKTQDSMPDGSRVKAYSIEWAGI